MALTSAADCDNFAYMKLLPVLSVAVALGLVACDTTNSSISSGAFNPLLPPGSGVRLADAPVPLKPGDHVRAIVDNTAFFNKLPQGDADADKILPRDTPMKVIRIAGTYFQVELDSTGEVGYVPSVMVEDRNASPPQPPGTLPPGTLPPGTLPPGTLPPGTLPPGTLPPGTLPPAPVPAVNPAVVPPDGAIPTVIDPAGE